MSPKYATSHFDTASAPPPVHHYACLLIGDELLGGHVADSNLPKIIAKLSPSGYALQEARIVTDAPEDIARHLTELRDAFAFVITMGGLGPTHDDRTMQGYALSFGCTNEVHKDMRAFFMQKPRATEEQIDAVTRMSIMPPHAEIIMPDETWPLIKIDNCYALPGLPSVCMSTADKLAAVLPVLQSNLYAECYVSLTESSFARWLEQLALQYPAVAIGSYPIDIDSSGSMQGEARAKLALTSANESAMRQCYKALCDYMTGLNAVVRVVPPCGV